MKKHRQEHKKEHKKVEHSEHKKPSPRPEEKVVSEKEQTEVRQLELLGVHTWMVTNNIQDIGQLEVKLAQVNQRLTEL